MSSAPEEPSTFQERFGESTSRFLGADSQEFGDGIAGFWNILVPAQGWPRFKRLLDMAVVAFGDLLVLYSMIEGLNRIADGTDSAKEAALFLFGLGVARWTQRGLITQVTQEFSEAARAAQERLLTGIQALQLDQFEQLAEGELLERVSADAEQVWRAGDLLLRAIGSLTLVILTLIYLASQVAIAAVLCFIPLCGLAIMAAVVVQKEAALHARAGTYSDAYNRNLTGLVRGFKQARQHAPRRQALMKELRERSGDLEAVRLELAAGTYQLQAQGRAMMMGLLLFIAFGLPALVPDAVTQRATLLVSVFFIARPLFLVFQVAPQLGSCATALGRITALERRLAELHTPATTAEIPPGFESLVLQQVRFFYDLMPGRQRFGLGPTDFQLSAKELVFVTGANGSGKSTFLKVLTGLYPHQSGTLSLNGVVVPERAPQQMRELVAMIFTAPVLFERLYGLEQVPAGAVNAMLEEMGLGEVVQYDGKRLSTINLSTGQQKRVAMAIARLSGRPLLVLDEWAADQDPVFRAHFYQHLLPTLQAQGTTVLAVTHDDDYFQVAGRRVDLKGGVIVDGTGS